MKTSGIEPARVRTTYSTHDSVAGKEYETVTLVNQIVTLVTQTASPVPGLTRDTNRYNPTAVTARIESAKPVDVRIIVLRRGDVGVVSSFHHVRAQREIDQYCARVNAKPRPPQCKPRPRLRVGCAVPITRLRTISDHVPPINYQNQILYLNQGFSTRAVARRSARVDSPRCRILWGEGHPRGS